MLKTATHKLVTHLEICNSKYMPIYQKKNSVLTLPHNAEITEKFLKLYQNDDVKKTHLFEGRYENIYLNEKHIPALKYLTREATQFAEDILAVKNLRAGYWFNYMPPGASTTLHTHDDDDELLSGVYYLTVPERSGNLIIYDTTGDAAKNKIEITPKAGEFIFFSPKTRHEVTKNNSAQYRISVGINFGLNN